MSTKAHIFHTFFSTFTVLRTKKMKLSKKKKCYLHTNFRKRSREDESCDFMPLSKRINNLHIANGNQHLAHNIHQNNEPMASSTMGDNNYLPHQLPSYSPYIVQHNQIPNNGNLIHENFHQPNGQCYSNNNNNVMEIYSPELSQDQNPHYYSKNKLLYDMHLERMRRAQ